MNASYVKFASKMYHYCIPIYVYDGNNSNWYKIMTSSSQIVKTIIMIKYNRKLHAHRNNFQKQGITFWIFLI